MNMIMKSPYTAKEMKLLHEKSVCKYRGDDFEYVYTVWQCEDTGERFTTDQTDECGLKQVTDKYRSKYGIPFQDEIIGLRKRYGLSAAAMSQILGFGINQYRLYEQGEVPNVSNGRIIRSVMNPQVMLDLVDSCREALGEKEYNRVRTKVQSAAQCDNVRDMYESQRVFTVARGLENGYAPLSLARLHNVILYLLEHCKDVFCTKMNKLLFYVDFLSYKETGEAMTGLSYKALEFGPAPDRWDRVYSAFDDIEQVPYSNNGYEGSILSSASKADTSQFSEDELQVLDSVCHHFGSISSREISRISHEEVGWKACESERKRIGFEFAFDLSI